MRVNEWHGNKWKENKVCDQVWPGILNQLSVLDWEHIHDPGLKQGRGLEPEYLWMARIRVSNRSETKSTGDWHINTNGIGRWGMISTCSEFRVSNLRSAIRVWPLNTSVQHRSPNSHFPFLSVIHKVSDLVGRCGSYFHTMILKAYALRRMTPCFEEIRNQHNSMRSREFHLRGWSWKGKTM